VIFTSPVAAVRTRNHQTIDLSSYCLVIKALWMEISFTLNTDQLTCRLIYQKIYSCIAALKPGHVIWVNWVTGSSALKYIRPRLNHMWREISEYTIWRCNDANLRSSWAIPTFCNRTLVSASTWKPHPCFVCIYMYKIQPFIGLHIATPINPLLLWASGMLPLQCDSFKWEYCCAKHVH